MRSDNSYSMKNMSTLESISAQYVKRDMSRSNKKLDLVNQRLSSGSRVCDPSKTPADAAIVAQMNSRIHAISGASQNIVQADSLIQMTSGALQDIQERLLEMLSLCVQASNGIGNPNDQSFLEDTFQAHLSQIDYNSKIKWGDLPVLDGGVGTASFVDPGNLGIATTSGFAMGTVDVGSVQVKFDGSGYRASLSIGGQSFQGTATPNIGSNLGYLSLTSTVDPLSKITIPFVDFPDGSIASAVVDAIENTVGFHTDSRTQFYPGSALTKSLVEDVVTNVMPSNTLSAGYHCLSYGTDGTNGVFKWQGPKSVTTTTFNIADLTYNTGTADVAFNGNITLTDGTVITLSNFDLTNNSSLPGAVSYMSSGGTKTFSIQSGSDFSENVEIKINVTNVMALGLSGQSLHTVNSAQEALTAVYNAIDSVAFQVASIAGNRVELEAIYNNLLMQKENQLIAKGDFQDADIPESIVEAQKLTSLVNVSSTQLAASLERLVKISELVQRVQHG